MKSDCSFRRGTPAGVAKLRHKNALAAHERAWVFHSEYFKPTAGGMYFQHWRDPWAKSSVKHSGADNAAGPAGKVMRQEAHSAASTISAGSECRSDLLWISEWAVLGELHRTATFSPRSVRAFLNASNPAALAIPRNRPRCVSPKTRSTLSRSRRAPDRTCRRCHGFARPVRCRDRNRRTISIASSYSACRPRGDGADMDVGEIGARDANREHTFSGAMATFASFRR